MMAATKRARVRPISRDPGQSRIRKLKCFPEVYDRILDGWPLSEIARFVHDIKKELLDLTRTGLIGALQEFRATIPASELTKKRLPTVFMNAVEKVESGLDELSELEKLYRLQMNRIAIDVQNEKNIKKLLPTTGQEVRIAREILSNYADLKMDLGLSKRHLGQMEVDARVVADVAVRYNKPEVESVLNDAQARKKVLNIAERLLSARAAASRVVEDPRDTITVEADAPDDDIPEETAGDIERKAEEAENLYEEQTADPFSDPIFERSSTNEVEGLE